MKLELALALLASLSFVAQDSPHRNQGGQKPDAKPAPPPADPAKKRLDDSPRHHEWIDVKRGEHAVHAFVVYPESKSKAPVVLVIHENKGLTDWVRSVADRLAELGYVAVAPDLLSGKGPSGGNTDAFPSVDAATKAIYELKSSDVQADLDALADHATKLDASNGKLFVAGFCWGGSTSFEYATHRKGLAAAFVFYGGAPKDEAALARIDAPVYGFYGENDARITGAVPSVVDAMKKAGKTYEPVIYDGAGHGFMRAGEAPDASDANEKAKDAAWERWKERLGKHSK